jgi:hypothetical protein
MPQRESTPPFNIRHTEDWSYSYSLTIRYSSTPLSTAYPRLRTFYPLPIHGLLTAYWIPIECLLNAQRERAERERERESVHHPPVRTPPFNIRYTEHRGSTVLILADYSLPTHSLLSYPLPIQWLLSAYSLPIQCPERERERERESVHHPPVRKPSSNIRSTQNIEDWLYSSPIHC